MHVHQDVTTSLTKKDMQGRSIIVYRKFNF